MYANYMFERSPKRYLDAIEALKKLNLTDTYSTVYNRNDLDVLFIRNNNGIPNIPIPTTFTTKFLYPK